MKSRSFAPLFLLLFLVTSCNVQTQDNIEFSSLSWISGNYADTSRNFFEYWVISGDNQLKGQGYAVKGSDTTFMEELTIKKADGKRCYIVKTGREETIFHLKGETGDSLVFENEENEFPKRIIYARKEDNKILASIDNPNDPISRIDFNLIPQK